DPFLRAIADLSSGRAERIHGALARTRPPDPGLTHLLIALLGREDVKKDVLRALRDLAPRVTGQLVDALVDLEQPAAVRRRILRVLKASPGPRAVDGLMAGLLDPDFGVRQACGAVLAWMRERSAELEVPASRVYAAAARELERVAAEPETQLDHVFTLLQTV